MANEEIRQRREERTYEFEPLWDKYLADKDKEKNENERPFMPHFDDICDLPAIATMLSENDATIPVTEERWLSVAESILSQLSDFRLQVQRDLTEKLKVPSHPNGYAEDLSIVSFATSMLKCSRCDAGLTYPTMFEHYHFRKIHFPSNLAVRWSRMQAMLILDYELQSTAKLVLNDLALPDDTPHAALESLSRRFICLCGHPDFQKPMSFASLVSFITLISRTSTL